jgi:hypothetical protein
LATLGAVLEKGALGTGRGRCVSKGRLAARIGAQSSDSIEELASVPKRCDAKLLQVLSRVLPSVDGTLASEVCCLLSAYDALKLPAARSTKARDHFVWLKPYRPKKDASISFAALPRPFLDVGRAQRLIRRDSREWEVWACSNNTIRVTGTDPWLDDPHTPKVTEHDRTKWYKLAAKPFDHRFQHHALFGEVGKNQSIERPRNARKH